MASLKGLFNRTFERLDDEQIAQLITQAQSGDVGARNKIVESFVPLIRHIAHKYLANKNVEEGDLVSYGVIGLMQAIETFDPSRGVKLQTHASNRIHGEIKDSFRQGEGLLVRTQRLGKGRVKLWGSIRNKLSVELDREPQIEEIEEATGIPLGVYLDAKFHASRKIFYADAPTNGGGHSGNGYKNRWEGLGLKFKHADFDDLDNKDFLNTLMEIGELTEKEKEIIKLRYGLREPTEEEWQRIVNGRPNAPGGRTSVPEYRSFLNCLDTGYVLNLCESRICQLELKALQKMKRALERMDSPNRRILSLYVADPQEQERREPEITNNRYNPQVPYTEPITQRPEIPLLEADIKPDTNGGHKRKSVHRQPKQNSVYMVRLESDDRYFDTEQEVESYIRDLFLHVGAKPDKIQIYRKLDFVIDTKIEIALV